MKLIKIITILFMLFLGSNLSATEQQKITLNDQSVLYGKVIKMSAGVYTIKTTSFGTIRVKSDNVQSITSSTSPKKSRSKKINFRDRPSRRSNVSKPDMAQTEVNSRVRKKMNDGNFLNDMLDISENNSMSNVMSDPEVMDAINNNDYEFLMNNDKMKDLMDSSSIKSLLGNFE